MKCLRPVLRQSKELRFSQAAVESGVPANLKVTGTLRVPATMKTPVGRSALAEIPR